MKILLDHDIPQGFRNHFRSKDEVYTVGYLQWQELTNGALLRAAQGAAFDVFMTLDQNIQFQQNLSLFGIAVILLSNYPNRLPDLIALLPDLYELLDQGVQPGTHYLVKV